MAPGSQIGLERWFRGEAVGVEPSRPGGDLHDYGDGFYLTDREDVANVYAQKRSFDPSKYRILTATIDRSSLGNVLDLTMDSRWQLFMTETKSMRGVTRLSLATTVHERFGQIFDEFIRTNKIDLNMYDAVIGPEYNLGGKQLCILHKNGAFSPLALRLKALLRPVSSVVATTALDADAVKGAVVLDEDASVIKTKLSFNNASIRRFAFSVGVTILITYLFSKLQELQDRRFIADQLEGFDAIVKNAVEADRRRVFDYLARGRRAYINVKYRITCRALITPPLQDPGTRRVIAPGYPVSAPTEVEFLGSGIYDYVADPGNQQTQNTIIKLETVVPLILSSEIVLPAKEIEIYRKAVDSLDWFDSTLRSKFITQSDVKLLTGQRRALETMIDATYGKMPNESFYGLSAPEIYGFHSQAWRNKLWPLN